MPPKRTREQRRGEGPPAKRSQPPAAADVPVIPVRDNTVSKESAPPAWFTSAMTRMSAELEEVKREASRAGKMQRKTSSATPVLKKEGLRRQFAINQEVLDNLEEAMESLPTDHEAKERLAESKSKLVSRQKHLRIADAYNWQTVEVYAEGKLGDGMADDQRIAEAAATARRLSPSYSSSSNDYFRRSYGRGRAGGRGGFTPPPYSRFGGPGRGSGFGAFANGGRMAPRVNCFACGQPGHMARWCPATQLARPIPRPGAPTSQHFGPAATPTATGGVLSLPSQ